MSDADYAAIVCDSRLPDYQGPQLLAALRTAGDNTPFVLCAPFCRDSVRAMVTRAGNATVIEDEMDARRLIEAVQAICVDASSIAGPSVQLERAQGHESHEHADQPEPNDDLGLRPAL